MIEGHARNSRAGELVGLLDIAEPPHEARQAAQSSSSSLESTVARSTISSAPASLRMSSAFSYAGTSSRATSTRTGFTGRQEALQATRVGRWPEVGVRTWR